MECFEIAEVIDTFGWAAELCITLFGGKEGIMFVIFIKLVGVVLDFSAFISSASANEQCGTDDDENSIQERSCYWGLYTFTILYILFQRIGALYLSCKSIKPWQRLPNNNTANNEIDNGVGPNILDLLQQDPKTKEERKKSAKLNMFWGAQWNLMDALTKRYSDAMDVDTQIANGTLDKKPKPRSEKTTAMTNALAAYIDITTGGAATVLKTKIQDEQEKFDKKQLEKKNNGENNNNNNNNNGNSNDTGNNTTAVDKETGAGAASTNTTDVATTTDITVVGMDETSTPATSVTSDSRIIKKAKSIEIVDNETNNNTNDNNNNNDNNSNNNNNNNNTNNDESFATKLKKLEDKEAKKERKLSRCSGRVKYYAILFAIWTFVDILLWFIISLGSLGSITRADSLTFGDVFPILWVVTSGYWAHMEQYVILFLSPIKTTVLGQNVCYIKCIRIWFNYC